MEEIRRYIDRLFEHVVANDEVEEFKAEVYSNMEAKVVDLVGNGMSKTDAIKKAQEDLISIDGLLESIHAVNYHQFRLDCLLSLLMASLVIWIFAIPALVVHALFAWPALVCVIALSIAYLKEKSNSQPCVRYLSVTHVQRIKKRVWWLWSLIFIVIVLTVTGVQFGSNIWFLRAVTFQGPYEFASKMVWYYLSAITILIPIAVSRFPQYLVAHINGGAK